MQVKIRGLCIDTLVGKIHELIKLQQYRVVISPLLKEQCKKTFS